MKTIEDLIDEQDFSFDNRFLLLYKFKQEAMKDIKTLKENIEKIGKLSDKAVKAAEKLKVQGKIEYIKEKFDIPEDTINDG